ncbi:MAG: YidC/Oxa1 family membrane protein insertase [Firmicutes bacterium]|nr:YidC/Oxa1 family membrane protein insertase [Bacillota bacterium]
MSAFFQSMLAGITNLVGSHGLAVILFTVLIRVILLPFDYKSRKSMRRMEKLNPQLQALQKKYANDKEKLQKKQAELYQKEKINPLGSCLPMLLTLPIFFIMFGAIRSMANQELVRSLLSIQSVVGDMTEASDIHAVLPPLHSLVEPFLWIKNLWVADSPFNSVLPSAANALSAVGNSIEGLITAEEMTALRAFVSGDVYQKIVLPFYNATPLPGGTINMILFSLTLFRLPNGFFILPLLAFVTQFFAYTLNPQPQQPQQEGQAGTGAFMKWFFPLFSIYICAGSNAAYSLYWVVTNLVVMIQQFVFRQYFEAQDRKAAAQAEEVKLR